MEKVEDGKKDKDEDREETVEEKIARHGQEVDHLQAQVNRIRSSFPPTIRPHLPEPLIKFRNAIKERCTQRELLLEEQRASAVVEEYLRENPSVLENVDECPICLEPIFDVDGAAYLLCCGNVTCCAEPLSAANDTCPLCREEFPDECEELSILRTTAAAGKAWAQYYLATRYASGTMGLGVDMEKAEYLYRKSADQGYSIAQFFLGEIECQRQNNSEAFKLFEAAASQGHMNALGRLGVYYCIGQGVEKDAAEAVRLLTVSSKLQTSDLRPHQMLGHCFAAGGGGIDRSLVRSIYYMTPCIEETETSPDFLRLYASILHGISELYYPDCKIPPSGHNNLPEALFWYRRAQAKSMNAEANPFLESYALLIKGLCGCCYKPLSSDKPKCCTECKAVYYCSRECQAADWKAGHKKDCVKSLKKRLRATGKFDDI